MPASRLASRKTSTYSRATTGQTIPRVCSYAFLRITFILLLFSSKSSTALASEAASPTGTRHPRPSARSSYAWWNGVATTAFPAPTAYESAPLVI